MNYSTEQENFWAGDFGNQYIARNDLSAANLSKCIASWVKILNCFASKPTSFLEFGPNVGLNLVALDCLLPGSSLTGVEINKTAAAQLRAWGKAKVFEQSILEFETAEKFDLVFTSGVLIHLAPEKLPDVYRKLYEASSQYICIKEYYNPTPVEVTYREHSEKLFKRDFAGELLDLYTDLELVDYGFIYHRDQLFSQDDFTWFVLRKRG